MKLETLFLLVLVASGNTGENAYENYKMYRIAPRTEQQVQALQNMHFDVWRKKPGKNASLIDIILPPSETEAFFNFVNKTNIEYQLHNNNINKHINNRVSRATTDEEFNWNNYHRLEQIYKWLDSLSKKYDHVSTLMIGNSFEGRPLKGVKISHRKGNKGVFLEGGIHAREWISPATVTFILHQLLTSTDPSVKNIAQSYDWYIFPVLNPDGYEYTFTHDRLWRKTRKPYDNCYGADLNRNWEYKWSEAGASTNPCSSIYAGPYPFSEPESYAMVEYISRLNKNLVAYLAFHAYSQLLLLPYGSSKKHLDNYDQALEIGRKAIESLTSIYGTEYKIGNIAEMLYPVTGSSIDYVKYTHETPLVYAFELRDTGHDGFQLPRSQIIPTGTETMAAVVTMMTEAKKRGIA